MNKLFTNGHVSLLKDLPKEQKDEILDRLGQYIILLFLGEVLQEGDVAIGEEFVHSFDDEVPGVVYLVVQVDLPG